MKKQFILAMIVVTAFVSSSAASAQTENQDHAPANAIACTMDAMMCPDGTFVGRTGPNCEFVCPTTTATPTEAVPNEPPSTPTPDPVTNPEPRPLSNLPNERPGALSTQQQQRIINLSANISNRLDAVVARLYAIIARLETRIEKTAQTGVDTTEATLHLRRAATNLADARSRLFDIDERVLTATNSDQPFVKWRELSEHYRTTGNLIREAHANLRSTVVALKTATTSETVSDASVETPPTETPDQTAPSL